MHRTAIAAVYLAFLLAGTAYVFQPTLESRLRHWQTNPGDTILNHYLLEHTWLAVSDGNYKPSLWSPPFFHPAKLVLGYSETLLGVAPIYWALRLGLPPNDAYPIWMMVMSALNFVAFAVVARWLKWPQITAIAGAMLWAFAVCHQYQIGHQQLIPRFWMPLAVYFLLKFVQSPNHQDLRKGLLFIALQMTACVNSAVILGDCLLIFTLVGLTVLGTWRKAWRSFCSNLWGYVGAFFFSGLLWFLAVLPVVLANAREGQLRGYSETVAYMPQASSWFAPPIGWRWSETLGHLRTIEGVCDECWLFSGVTYVALLIFAVLPILLCRRDRLAAKLAFALALTAVLMALAVVKWDGYSAWYALRFLPGGLAIRAIGRMYIGVYLLLTFGGFLGLHALLAEWFNKPWLRHAVLAMLGVAMLFEQTGFQRPSFDTQPVHSRFEPLARLMHGADAAFLEIATDVRNDPYSQLRAMWAGQIAGVPVLNGYTGRWPVGFRTEPGWTDDDYRRWLGPTFQGRLAIIDEGATRVRYLEFP